MASKSASLLLMLPLIAVLEGGSQPVSAATPSPARGEIGFLSIDRDVVTVDGTRPQGEIKLPRTAAGSFHVDPMSNIVSRQPVASWIWVVLPYSFIGFFALACGGLVIDLRRQPPAKEMQPKRFN